MELRHLRYFVAVAEAGNITRAAASLNISQPPLSRQIQDLESELGVPLFERMHRTLTLTNAGTTLLRESRKILALVDEAVQKTVKRSGRSVIEVHIGYSPSPSIGLLPQAIAAFEKAEPGARVQVHDMSTVEMLQALNSKRIELALMASPAAEGQRKLRYQPLLSFPVGFIVPTAHPLTKQKHCTVAEALKYPLVGYSRADYADYHAWLMKVLGLKRPPKLAEECDGHTSLVTALQSGRGICMNGSIFRSQSPKHLRFVPLAPAPASLDVGIGHTSRSLSPMAQKFVQSMVDTAAILRRSLPPVAFVVPE